ncbi:MAG: hypothetical protein ABIJ12_03765 [bacterium]
MSSIKLLIPVLILLFIACHPGKEKNDIKKLSLDISLSKKTYLLNEPIWLDVTLKNISDENIRIYGLCPSCLNGSLSIDMVDSLGKEIRYSGYVYDMVPGKGWILEPQEEYYRCFNLLETNGFINYGLIGAMYLKYLPSGKYRMRAHSWRTYSQELSFEVMEPIGEEKATYDDYINAVITDQNNNDKISFENENIVAYKEDKLVSVYKRLKLFLEKYPNCQYSEKVSWDIDKSTFLEKFPNSGFNESNLRYLTDKMEDSEKINFLYQVIIDYPNTRSCKFAEQMLRMMDKEEK